MKKNTLLFILLTSIFGLSNAFAQNVRLRTSFQNDIESLLKVNPQNKISSEFNKQTKCSNTNMTNAYDLNTNNLFKSSAKELLWNPDTIVSYGITNLESRNVFTYDANGNRLAVLSETWDIDTWKNFWKRTYSYNNSGKQLTLLFWSWTNDIWKNYERYTFTYDDYGNMLTELHEELINGTWKNVLNITSIYDSNGNAITELTQEWISDAWWNSQIKTYTFDNNQNMLTMLIENWGNNAWAYDYRYTYTHDDIGNRLTMIIENWGNDAWDNYYNYSYTYDNNGKMLTMLIEEWNIDAWQNFWRFTNTYDETGNLTIELLENWENDAWLNSAKKTYTSDINGNSVTGLCEYWTDDTWQPDFDFLGLYINQNYIFDVYDAYRYVASFTPYTSHITSIKDDNNIAIFPNPATQELFLDVSNFSTTSVKLFSIQGQLFQSLNLQTNVTKISLDGLPKGLYILEITNPTKIEYRKFIKE